MYELGRPLMLEGSWWWQEGKVCEAARQSERVETRGAWCWSLPAFASLAITRTATSFCKLSASAPECRCSISASSPTTRLAR